MVHYRIGGKPHFFGERLRKDFFLTVSQPVLALGRPVKSVMTIGF
jgi:hypothetical protein